MISCGRENTITLDELQKCVSEADLLHYYVGVSEIPCVIKSPLREDHKASFGLYTLDGVHIYYTDFATKEKGSTYSLLSKLWALPFKETLNKIYNEIVVKNSISVKTINHPKMQVNHRENTRLEVKVRNWQKHDIDYWDSYGISLEWLKWAEVYPISHKIVIKNNKRLVFPADKYAYAFVEHKEDTVTIKVYQPFNTKGYKWSNKHDRSVVSLWTKIPQTGDKVVICSSLKDALSLSANTLIPALAIQGEGYGMSDTAINELKRRFTKQFIILDNDEVGLQDAVKLAERTGFKNIILPPFVGGKDISDYYKLFGKSAFIDLFKKLFNYD